MYSYATDLRWAVYLYTSILRGAAQKFCKQGILKWNAIKCFLSLVNMVTVYTQLLLFENNKTSPISHYSVTLQQNQFNIVLL